MAIATRVIEGACRHLVKDRCEISGMHCTCAAGDWATRGAYRPYDALLWVSGGVLILIPVMADIGNITGWSEPDTLYPTLLSVGVVIRLVVWDEWAVWSRRRDDTRGIVGEDA